jgi:hypothetical protein
VFAMHDVAVKVRSQNSTRLGPRQKNGILPAHEAAVQWHIPAEAGTAHH